MFDDINWTWVGLRDPVRRSDRFAGRYPVKLIPSPREFYREFQGIWDDMRSVTSEMAEIGKVCHQRPIYLPAIITWWLLAFLLVLVIAIWFAAVAFLIAVAVWVEIQLFKAASK
jgi:hypothetical protein